MVGSGNIDEMLQNEGAGVVKSYVESVLTDQEHAPGFSSKEQSIKLPNNVLNNINKKLSNSESNSISIKKSES